MPAIDNLSETIMQGYLGPCVRSEEGSMRFVVNLLLHEADETKSSETDVRKEKLKKIYDLLHGYTRAHKDMIKGLEIDPEDFVQEVVTNIYRRQGLDKYDPNKGKSFETLIFNIAKRHAIDIHRKRTAKSRLDDEGKPIGHGKSLETPIGARSQMADKELTLGDVTPDRTQDLDKDDLISIIRYHAAKAGKSKGGLADLLRRLREKSPTDLKGIVKEIRSRGKGQRHGEPYADYILRKKHGG